MPIISAVGIFCYDKFEETPNEKEVKMSKLTNSYFKKNKSKPPTNDIMELAELSGEEDIEDKDDMEEDEEINVIIDKKKSKKKSKPKGGCLNS